jgi:hypothetical protein
VTVTFNLAAAEAAEGRYESGKVPLPGDRDLVEALDSWRSVGNYRFERLCEQQRRQAWLAGQCPECEPDAYGPECDSHYVAWDKAIERTCDV